MASQAFTPGPTVSISVPRAGITEQQPSSSDQLPALVNFIEQLGAEAPTIALAKETDGNTALLGTLNTIVSVVRVIYP